MSLWDDFSNAAGEVVDAAVDAGEDVVETVGDVVSDFVETAGNAAEDGLDAAGEAVAGVPAIGGFLRGTARYLGGAIAGVTNLVSAVIKGVFGIVAGVIGGVLKIAAGILLLNSLLIFRGMTDIGSTIAGGVTLVAGTLLAALQRLVFAQNRERPLTKAERDLLRRVFLNSVALYNVRLVEGWSGAFGVTDRAFTLGNVIYMKDDSTTARPDILVHECVHVWQYQNIGSRYTTDALVAQAAFPTDAYDWEAEIARGNTTFLRFNKEAAASHIQDIWTGGSLTVTGSQQRTGGGAFFDLQGGTNDPVEFLFNGTDYTQLATASVKTLRDRVNPRWSRAF